MGACGYSQQSQWIEKEIISNHDIPPIFDGKHQILVPDATQKCIVSFDITNNKIKALKDSICPDYINTVSNPAFNVHDDYAYIYGNISGIHHNSFMQYNLKNNSIVQHGVDNSSIPIGAFPSSVIVDNIWHIVGSNGVHVQIHLVSPKFVVIASINYSSNNIEIPMDVLDVIAKYYGMVKLKFRSKLVPLFMPLFIGDDSRLLYVENINELVLFTGEYDDDKIFFYDLNRIHDQWYISNEYVLPQQMARFGCVMFDKYIILFGGYNDSKYLNTIYYANYEDFEWKKLKHTCPIPGKYNAVLVNETIHLFVVSDTKKHFCMLVSVLMDEIYERQCN
eukprot:142521_1